MRRSTTASGRSSTDATASLLYRTVAPAVTQIQRSDDGGLTYGPAASAGAIGQVGEIDVHQPTGTVYVSGSSGQVCTGTPPAPGAAPTTLDYVCHQAATGSVANIFFVVKVADDGTPNGTVYVAYSDGHDIFLADSVDKGATWSQPVKVSHSTDTRTSLFPWLETGPTPGSVGGVWYGTSSPSNVDGADWKAFYAQSYDATSSNPTLRQVIASDHFIHASSISTGGTLGTANRNLLDYFQVSFDPKGAAVIAYTDDHNDYDGHTYVTHQIGGPGLNPSKGPVPSPGPAPAAQSGPYPNAAAVGGEAGSQVTDFRHDVADALLVVTPTDDPLDVLSVKYSAFGTAVRNSDGSLSHTRQGTATGSFDTITTMVPLSSLNPFVTHGPAIASGSILVGLRGQSFTSQVNGKRDVSRGGTQYAVGCGAADLSVTKTDSPDPVHIGQNLTYTVTVTNNGPDAASGVTAADQLPKNAGYGSASTTQGTCSLKPEKATVSCDLGTIADGGTVTITINVKPTKEGQITNTATVSSTSPLDPNTANNTASTTTTVQP